MISIKQVQVKKNRSCAACISAAHKMFYDNINNVFCHIWPYSLACALTISIFYLFYVRNLLYGETILNSIVTYVSFGLAICLQVVYSARTFMLVNGQTMRWNIMRSFRLFFLEICMGAILIGVCLVVVSCFNGLKLTTTPEVMPKTLAIVTICSLVYGCFMLPFGYLAMKYIVEPDTKLLRLIIRKYTIGLRYWGLIFTTFLFIALCAFIITILLSMPMVIVSVANVISVIGVKQFGDPAGLPAWFAFLLLGVTTLSVFISLIVNVFFIFVCYLLYGSIEVRVKERTEYLKTKE